MCFSQDEEDFYEEDLLPLIAAFQKTVQTRQFRTQLADAENMAVKWVQVNKDNGKLSNWDDTFRPAYQGPRRRYSLN